MPTENNNHYVSTTFCKHCGSELSPECQFCPKCGTEAPIVTQYQPSTNNPPKADANQQNILEKKIKSFYIIIPISMFITALITAIITCFIFSYIFDLGNTSNNNSNGSSSVESTNDVCPEDKNGIHQWGTANCVRPSVCWSCGAYKDDKLGHHEFHYDEDIEEIVCYHCHILKSEYDNQK